MYIERNSFQLKRISVTPKVQKNGDFSFQLSLCHYVTGLYNASLKNKITDKTDHFSRDYQL